MKKIILIAALMMTFVGFCGNRHPNHIRRYNPPRIHHVIHHHAPRMIWIAPRTVIIGYNILNLPIFRYIPGHYEFR